MIFPNPKEEKESPSSADEVYRGAVDWLLEATRGDERHHLVKNENIDYGFRRNLLGLKLVGLTLVFLCLLINVWLGWANHTGYGPRFWTAVVLGAALVGGLLAWVFWVRLPFVEDASRSYAQRLLAQCDVLDTAASSYSDVKTKY